MIAKTLALVLLMSPAFAEPAFIRDSVTPLRSDNDDFGGFSAIHISSDGSTFIALSDRGNFQNGTFQRSDGRITGVTLTQFFPVLDTRGRPLTGRNIDSEGLAVSNDGTIYVSFESNSRIMWHESQLIAANFLPKHPDFYDLQTNSGLEALAIDGDDTIYAIPERSGELDRPFPIYRFKNDTWDTNLQIPREPPFLVVGADVFEGKLYLLERHFGGILGFQTRIRRFGIEQTLTNAETLLTSRSGEFDNLEGISIWRDSSGQIRATLISDDNFKFYQRNQIVEYILQD